MTAIMELCYYVHV